MELWKTVAAKQKEYFWTNETRPVEFRINQLKKLKQALVEWEDRILEALNRDLGKPKAEAYSTEIGMVHAQINEALLGIRKWTMRKNVSASIINFYSEGELIWEPYGTVLIFAPWNYPLQLTISPPGGSDGCGKLCSDQTLGRSAVYGQSDQGSGGGELFAGLHSGDMRR